MLNSGSHLLLTLVANFVEYLCTSSDVFLGFLKYVGFLFSLWNLCLVRFGALYSMLGLCIVS